MTHQKILLTGGTGFIGSHTAVEVIHSGYDVVIADDLSNSDEIVIDRIGQITRKRPVFYKIDVSDKAALRNLFAEQNIGAVIHFAGFKAVGESVAKPLDYYRNNLDTTLSLLEVMEEFAVELEEDFDISLSQKVKLSFRKFYAERGLYDVIEPDSREIRPNQIFAIGLAHSPVDEEKAKEVLQLVEDTLYTPQGLKTLSSNSPSYVARYEGDSYHRDLSYHQGTVWPWLLIPFFYAAKRWNGRYQKLEKLDEMLSDDCIGSICEIYDAEEPRLPKGAISQAWSVAMGILETNSEKGRGLK